ncbi:MAG: TIGR01777 family oxidoreductase [Gemmatimonadaceae bacterium]
MIASETRDVPARVAIGGASGMIGGAVASALTSRGTKVERLVRSAKSSAPDEIWWNPDENQIDGDRLAGVDAVLHFGGRSIDDRWTEEVKQEIRQSRIRSTRLLAETIAALDRRPRTLLVASGSHYYGDRDAEVLEESSARGHGFLTDVVVAWEAAADPARDAGVRVVNTRFGVVMAAKGGALDRMLPIFKMGAGGTLGHGRQWLSWIAIDDLVRAVLWLLDHPEIDGGVNVTSPNPVTNAEFTETLGRVLGRPTLVRVPALALKVMYGEMGETLLLGSQRMVPRRLLDAGFTFDYPELEAALRHVLDA